MSRIRFADAVALGSLAVASGLSLAVHHRLPERVATHFDLHGEPDGFMPRTVAATFLPAFGLGLWAFVRLAPRILPASERRRLGENVVPIVAALKAVFLSVLHVAVLGVALVPGFAITRPLWLGVGAVFVGLGLVMPRVRRNALVGIRTPWTLSSDENWARTHRVAGYAMIASGLAAAVVGCVGGAVATVLAVACLLAGAIVPSVYSLVLARRRDA